VRAGAAADADADEAMRTEYGLEARRTGAALSVANCVLDGGETSPRAGRGVRAESSADSISGDEEAAAAPAVGDTSSTLNPDVARECPGDASAEVEVHPAEGSMLGEEGKLPRTWTGDTAPEGDDDGGASGEENAEEPSPPAPKPPPPAPPPSPSLGCSTRMAKRRSFLSVEGLLVSEGQKVAARRIGTTSSAEGGAEAVRPSGLWPWSPSDSASPSMMM
jgi:hypothetical protein